MKYPLIDAKQSLQDHANAIQKVRMWANRGDKARQAGRKADADRCADKVRDWASKVSQIERRLSYSQPSR